VVPTHGSSPPPVLFLSLSYVPASNLVVFAPALAGRRSVYLVSHKYKEPYRGRIKNKIGLEPSLTKIRAPINQKIPVFVPRCASPKPE
jgi:hypothetical protein